MENFIKEVEVNGISHSITLGDNMVGSGLKKDENGVVSLDINEEKLVKITYSELKSLSDNSQLTPGSFYRIIDYVTTTALSETKSANHPFDVIVLALSENTLCEDAKAILHEGDTYFADSDLNAWELKYCLDNDKTRFEWADETNGKGVIYRMIDEKRNDCPYDFKNILFYNTKLTSITTNDKYYYTFSYVRGSALYDGTTEKQAKACYGNVMSEYRKSGVLQLNKNVFRNTSFGNYCYYNTFGDYCHSNTFGDYCHSNTFGNNCYYNTFGNNCYSNTFGDYCHSNTFGNNCYYNTFGNYCYYNTFGNYCSNTFGNNCRYNTLGDECYSNTFEDSCENNTLGHSDGFNTFSNNCTDNTIGYDCQYNTFGTGCYINTFGNECSRNTFGKTCHHNTFGNGLQNRSLDSDKTSITLNEEFYDDGSGQLVPTKHPDLSTQPSILPYKFMGQYVYEQLIPHDFGGSKPDYSLHPLSELGLAVEKPILLQVSAFNYGSYEDGKFRSSLFNGEYSIYIKIVGDKYSFHYKGLTNNMPNMFYDTLPGYIHVVYSSFPETGENDYYGY